MIAATSTCLRLLLFALTCIAASGAPASAARRNLDQSTRGLLHFADQLGEMAGSEKLCGLLINAEKLAEQVATLTDPDGDEFTDRMRTAADLMPTRFAEMTPSMQVVHCSQMKRLSESLDLDTGRDQ